MLFYNINLDFMQVFFEELAKRQIGRRPGESRGPASDARSGVPAFAGMTPEKDGLPERPLLQRGHAAGEGDAAGHEEEVQGRPEPMVAEGRFKEPPGQHEDAE